MLMIMMNKKLIEIEKNKTHNKDINHHKISNKLTIKRKFRIHKKTK